MICMSVLSPPVAIHCLFRFPASFLGSFVLATVPRFFTLRQCDLNLGNAVAEVNSQGDNGQSLRFCAARQLENFFLVHQQLSIPQGFMIPRTAWEILRDMSVHQIGSAGLEINESVANIRLALAQRFHLGALQNQPRLHFFQNVIVVVSRALLRDEFFGGIFPILLTTFHRFVLWLSHKLSFYLMTRLIEISDANLALGLRGRPCSLC